MTVKMNWMDAKVTCWTKWLCNRIHDVWCRWPEL